MGDLTIEDIDDELMEALRERAVGRGRSTEAEVRAIIREAVSGTARSDKPLCDRAAIIEELRRFRARSLPLRRRPSRRTYAI